MASIPPAPGRPGPSKRLNVIALVSGGKDSFFSLLHCMANGHRVVALANLCPARLPGTTSNLLDGTSVFHPPVRVGGSVRDHELPHVPGAAGPASSELDEGASGGRPGDDDEVDLNSFMYQTVGHQVTPLYAKATGIPLYRQPIAGSAIQHARPGAVRPSSFLGKLR